MVSKLGWIAIGGLGVGVISLSLVATLHAGDLRGFDLGDIISSGMACRDMTETKIDPNATERRWTWDGGDEVKISVPATVHYRGGEGDEVIARGSPETIARLDVSNGEITYACRGRKGKGDLHITLPGRVFQSVTLAGSGDIIMENVNQPRLDLALAGSGSVRAQGTSDRVSVSIAGSGDAKLAELAVKQLDINIAGSANAEASPQEEINVKIAGSGDVRLLTNPPHVNTKIMGSGQVIRASGS